MSIDQSLTAMIFCVLVLQTAWFGASPVSTTGRGKEVGATRSFVQQGFTFVEELVKFSREKGDGKGGFVQAYGQASGSYIHGEDGREMFCLNWIPPCCSCCC